MLRVASDQPSLLPWPGFWHKLMSVDLMIYNLGVPVSHGAGDHYHNRVRLRGSWLTLPLTKQTRSGLWRDLEMLDDATVKAAKTIRNCFGKRFAYAERVRALATAMEAYPDRHLATLNMKLVELTATMLGIPTATAVDTSIPDRAKSKTERLIERVRRFAGDGPVAYHLGRGALDYIDARVMQDHGIRLFVQTWDTRPDDESILELLASEPDPKAVIAAMGHWEELA